MRLCAEREFSTLVTRIRIGQPVSGQFHVHPGYASAGTAQGVRDAHALFTKQQSTWLDIPPVRFRRFSNDVMSRRTSAFAMQLTADGLLLLLLMAC